MRVITRSAITLSTSIALAMLANCHRTTQRTTKHELHVTAVTICGDPPAVGTLDGMRLTLSLANPIQGVACPSPFRPSDVGKDFRVVSRDDGADELVIDDPPFGTTTLAIGAVSEIPSAKR